MSTPNTALEALKAAGMRISSDRDYQKCIGGFSVEKDGQQIAVFGKGQGERALERAMQCKGCVVVLIDPRKETA